MSLLFIPIDQALAPFYYSRLLCATSGLVPNTLLMVIIKFNYRPETTFITTAVCCGKTGPTND